MPVVWPSASSCTAPLTPVVDSVSSGTSFSTVTVIRPVKGRVTASPSRSVAVTCTYWPRLVMVSRALSPAAVGWSTWSYRVNSAAPEGWTVKVNTSRSPAYASMALPFCW